ADDLRARLARFLAARESNAAAAVYLGQHQRLDKDSSGVVLFSKCRAVNPNLATQWEGRQVGKHYVAACAAPQWGQRSLQHTLVWRGGRMQALPNTRPRSAQPRGAVEARAHATVRCRQGERALLDVTLHTGRRHQIRSQLAATGHPIAGDPLYGRVPAPRLLLHAERLSLRHPRTGAPLSIEAPLPPLFTAWVQGRTADLYNQPQLLHCCLAHAFERRWALAHADPGPDGRPTRPESSHTDCFRLVHGAGDGLPGLDVDKYGDYLVLHLRPPALAHEATIVAALRAPTWRGLYVKRHPHSEAKRRQHDKDELAPPAPAWGEATPRPLVVQEAGIPYAVQPAQGLSPGLFLDQRENRKRVRALAAGGRMLNLFCFTGSFTVAAAAGGARETLSVDLSQAALRQVGQALTAYPGVHRRWREDAFVALRRAAERGMRFDVIVADPPTFARSPAGVWRSGKQWQSLCVACLRVLAPGGHLLCCSNDEAMQTAQLRRYMTEAAQTLAVPVTRMRATEPAVDCPTAIGQKPRLKSVWLTRA
ncbi:MAG: class I SAM-dependent methyltransferase, partial [Polyangiales bacterium]